MKKVNSSSATGCIDMHTEVVKRFQSQAVSVQEKGPSLGERDDGTLINMLGNGLRDYEKGRQRRFGYRIFGTFAFAPSHKANASVKLRESICQRFFVLLQTPSLYRKYFHELKSYL